MRTHRLTQESVGAPDPPVWTCTNPWRRANRGGQASSGYHPVLATIRITDVPDKEPTRNIYCGIFWSDQLAQPIAVSLQGTASCRGIPASDTRRWTYNSRIPGQQDSILLSSGCKLPVAQGFKRPHRVRHWTDGWRVLLYPKYLPRLRTRR